MSNDAVLQLRNVSKRIGMKTIIDDLSFDVPRGKVFGFLGPNGAGKTTTIRMIVGLMSMSKGEIFIDGISIKQQFEKAMTKVGAIVENPEMYKFLTGYQNLVHYARMNPGVTRERIDEVVELVGMSNRIHERVKKYSLGMRQRLGIAQALLHKPSLLILDEPTNGLDPAGIRELRDHLRSLTRMEGISVLVSSHLLSEMELMCDEVAIIQTGKLIDLRSMESAEDAEVSLKVTLEVSAVEPAIQALHNLENNLAVQPQAVEESIQNDVAEAHSAVSPIFTNYVQLDNSHIEVQLQREQIPLVIAAFVYADVAVYSVRAHTKTLEDQFLEMTRSEQIV